MTQPGQFEGVAFSVIECDGEVIPAAANSADEDE